MAALLPRERHALGLRWWRWWLGFLEVRIEWRQRGRRGHQLGHQLNHQLPGHRCAWSRLCRCRIRGWKPRQWWRRSGWTASRRHYERWRWHRGTLRPVAIDWYWSKRTRWITSVSLPVCTMPQAIGIASEEGAPGAKTARGVSVDAVEVGPAPRARPVYNRSPHCILNGGTQYSGGGGGGGWYFSSKKAGDNKVFPSFRADLKTVDPGLPSSYSKIHRPWREPPGAPPLRTVHHNAIVCMGPQLSPWSAAHGTSLRCA